MKSSLGPSKNSILVVMALVFICIAGTTTAHMQTTMGNPTDIPGPLAAPKRSTSECVAARAPVPLTSEKASGATLRLVAGTLTIGEEGLPAAHAVVQLMKVSNTSPGSDNASHTVADEKGRWTAKGLSDGKYVIVFDPPTVVGCETPPETVFVSKRAEIEVAGGDVQGLDVRADRGGRISGKVEMEGGEPIPNSLVVMPLLGEGPGYPPIRIGPVEKDGTFAVSGVPTGGIELKVFVFGRPHDHRIISISVAGGAPVDRLQVQEGGEIKDLRVRLARAK